MFTLFNRYEARSGRRKDESEQVFAEVPAIIEPCVFEQVQGLLKARNPRHLADRLLDPQRLGAMLASLASGRAARASAVDERIVTLEREAYEVNERLRRLYKAMEAGVAEMDDILKDRIIALKADRDRVYSALERARSGVRPSVNISPIVVERFGEAMREKLTTGEVPFRKAYLGSLIDRVEVDDREIRIVGRKDVLEQTVLANGAPAPGVRSFVRKWRTGEDSNP